MKSEAHMRFENLLRRVVSVPDAEVKRRMDAEKTAKEWAKENDLPISRTRPIVSPAAVSSSKNRV